MPDLRQAVVSSQAPAAVGPYSHAVLTRNLLFCSGQLPVDSNAPGSIPADIAAQTRRCLENLEAVCESAGTSLANAARLTVYTTDLARFSELNQAYAEYFGEDPPARAAIGVAALPLGAAVEIDAVVAVPPSAD